MSYRTSYTSFITAFALLFAVVSASVLTGCDSTVNEEGESTTTTTETTIENPPEEPFDATGTVSGRVMDRVTDAPIEGATVRIDLADSLTATTGADGSFSFDSVPANRSDEDGSNTGSGTYNIHLSTPDGSPYRDFYTAEVELVFGDTDGGSGPGNNMAASVTFELAKLNGTITGRVGGVSDLTGELLGIPGLEIALHQKDFTTRSASDGDEEASSDTSEVLLETITTGEDGSFAFENVEEDGSFDIDIIGINGNALPENLLPGGAIHLAGTETPLVLDPSTVGTTRNLGGLPVPLLPPLSGEFVEFAEGLDLSSTDPQIVIGFDQPVAQNDYTVPDAEATGDNIAKDFVITVDSVAAKNPFNFARDDNGDILFTPSWNEDFTELTLTTSETLPDGFTYEADLSALTEAGKGFVSASFEQGLADLTGLEDVVDPDPDDPPTLAERLGDIEFSVGVNNDVPAAPTFEFTDGEQGTFDYADASVTQNIAIEADDEDGLVAGYEVFVLDANAEVKPLDEDGLPNDPVLKLTIDEDASFGEITTGELGVDPLTVDEQPFIGAGGSYEPIEILVRAVSINQVPGETTTLTVVDNDAPSVTSDGSDGNDEDDDDITGAESNENGDEITVEYDEPLNLETIDAADYALIDPNPDDDEAPPAVTRIVATDQNQSGTEVTFALESALTTFPDLEVGGQTDLAGNDLADDLPGADVETDIPVTDKVAPTVEAVAATEAVPEAVPEPAKFKITVTFSEAIGTPGLSSNYKLTVIDDNDDQQPIKIDNVDASGGEDVILTIIASEFDPVVGRDGIRAPRDGDVLTVDAGGPEDVNGNKLEDSFESESIADEVALDVESATFADNGGGQDQITITYSEPFDEDSIGPGDYTLIEDNPGGSDTAILLDPQGIEPDADAQEVTLGFADGAGAADADRIQIEEQTDVAGNDIAANETDDDFEEVDIN